MSNYINPDFDLGSITFGRTDLNIQKYLNRDYDNIYQASVDLPVILQFLTDTLQDYKIKLLNKKNKIRRLEAQLYLRIKKYGMEEMGFSGKITEETVLRAIALDPEIQEEQDSLAVIIGTTTWIQNTIQVFSYKIEMIRSKEATNRSFFQDTIEKDDIE